MTEDELMSSLIDAGHAYGYQVAHFRSVRVQRQNGMTYYATPVQADGKGFVDTVFAKMGKPLLFVECKSDSGVLSEAQERWLRLLDRASSPALVIRPKDFDRFVALLK